MDELVSVILIV